MNRSILGRAFSVLLLFYILAFVGFFLYSYATFSATQALSAFQWKLSMRQAFLLFIQYLIPVHVSGIVVAFSVSGSPGGRARGVGGRADPFRKMASSTLAAFLFLAIVYTVFFEVLVPYARRDIASIEQQSALARQLLDQVKIAESRKDSRTALGDIQRYLRIDPSNRDVIEKKHTLEAEVSSLASQAAKDQAPASPKNPAPEQAAALMAAANKAFAEGDYRNAHLYATQAYKAEPGRSDAIKLAAEAWGKITGDTPADMERTAAVLYREKMNAYALLAEQPLKAYYAFLALKEKYPADKDIAQFLGIAGEKIKGAFFFIQDAAEAFPYPGTESILFLNGKENETLSAVSIGKMVESDTGTFFYDIEAVSYKPDGTVVYRFFSKYGKLGDDNQTVLFHAVDRQDGRIEILPAYYTGVRPEEQRYNLKLTPSMEELRAMSLHGAGIASLGLADLWRMRPALTAGGAVDQGISVEIVMDVLMPLLFLTLSFFAVSFGWAFRPRYLGRPPMGLFLLIPLVPAVAAVLSMLWVYAHRVILGFVVLAAGLVPALITCAALELVVLVAGLILLAGQSGDA